MSEKKTPMTPDAAARVQSATDRGSAPADGFKERAQRAAVDSEKVKPAPQGSNQKG